MNDMNISDPVLDKLIKQTLRDDLPPEAEAWMSRRFLRFKRTLDQVEGGDQSDAWFWARWALQKETLAFAALIMMILGGLMHLNGSQNALAHSLEGLKTVVGISESLARATSMDCTVAIQDAAVKSASYRVRWLAAGLTRVDMDSNGGAQTLWMSNRVPSMADYAGIAAHSPAGAPMPANPVWQPALEFLTPSALAQHMKERYGLSNAARQSGCGPNEFLLLGQFEFHHPFLVQVLYDFI